ncbi:GNAT family N-acetyltransferase, partial [Providencia vermicola]|nr:GNAT family N-acetyltransferase [Providencia vermicola]
MNVEIKPATRQDAALILDMIIELADYEKARHEVKASVTDIENSLFGSDSNTEALICYIDGQPAGYAVFFTSYSTWLG